MMAKHWLGRLNFVGMIVGGIIGFAFAGPMGAVAGLVLGHVYDRFREAQARARRRRRSRSSDRLDGAKPLFDDPTETRRIAFATAIIVLSAKLAKADGAVTQDEIAAFKRHFLINDADVGGVAHIYNQAKKSAEGFEPSARQIAAMFGRDPIMLEELLCGLFEIARSDGDLQPGEIEFLRQVAQIFGFDDAKFAQIQVTFSATRGATKNDADAYQLLGIARNASDDEIKKIYRMLVRELHPDRLIAKGLPQEFISRANDRLAAINAAYDMVAKQRGFK